MVVSLRAGERMYLNGAVFRVDRKVSIEILNDVSFLMEAHVMQPEDTVTPLRQLYFVIQTMMIDAEKREQACVYFASQHIALLRNYANLKIIDGLCQVKTLVLAERYYEALKQVRLLFPIEDKILDRSPDDASAKANPEGRSSRSVARNPPATAAGQRKTKLQSVIRETPVN